MALFKTRSAAVYGIDAHLIDVEVDMYRRLRAGFIMVGMPDMAVRESRERIKSALMNSGFGYPNKAHHHQSRARQCAQGRRGLRPAHGHREFSARWARSADCDQHLLVGELSLDGAIRPVRGALSMAVCAREQGIANLIVPRRTPPRPRWWKASRCTACGIWRRWWRC